jgi:tetratricopeptide (TPR) repeat protein
MIKTWIRTLTMLAALLMGSTAALATQAWIGELEVLSEAGPGCDPVAGQPAKLRIQVARVEDASREGGEAFVVWGELQSVRFVFDKEPGAAQGRPLSANADWEVKVSTGPQPGSGRWTGTWQEGGAAGEQACLFQSARFELRAVTDPAEEAGLVRHGQQVAAMHALLTPLLRARDGAAWQAAAQRTLDEIQATGWQAADREVATLLLEGARRGWAFRQRTPALALAARSSALLQAMGPSEALSAARAIRREASMIKRAIGPEAAFFRLDEAIDWLERHGMAETADMAALLSTRGNWLMQAHQWEEAQKSFERASRIESGRQAPPTDRAVALHNWAASLDKGGRSSEAYRLWIQARDLLVRSDQPSDRALLSLIEEAIGEQRPMLRGVRVG